MKLIETIRFEDGSFENLAYHQKRMNDSRKTLFGCDDKIDIFPKLNPGFLNPGLYKCRMVYSQKIEDVAFSPYAILLIKSLKIVFDDKLDYSHKFFNRSPLENLFQQKEGCDDILIVKNGLITDTSYANILFYNGKDWITPEKPLLKGTQRAKLLQEEKIKTADIRVQDLQHFKKARLINAMIRFEDELEVEIDHIIQ